jgi:hypothetical protein
MGTDINALVQVRVGGTWVTVVLNPCDGTRNYRTFGILAGVRGSDAIASPRGLPSDFQVDQKQDPYLQTERTKSYWMGSHSHSYLTLAEIQAYCKPRLVTEGFVSEGTYLSWKNPGSEEPRSHYPQVSGSACVTMSTSNTVLKNMGRRKTFIFGCNGKVFWKELISHHY